MSTASPQRAGGNAKHQAAVAATAELVTKLRTEIHTQLEVLVDLDHRLEDLADTRQSVGPGFLTPEAKELANKQARADRDSARGIPSHTDRSMVTGLAWIGGRDTKIPGVHPAPVTMPAVSAAAEISFTLQHHIRRLARPALLATLEAEQTEAEDHGWCTWPRRTIAAHPPVTEGSVAQLAVHLGRLVDAWSNRPGLQGLLRDLEHLEETAKNVVDGPAKTSHPEACPWCGRTTLVILHREPGRDSAVIRCEGKHPCTCTDPWCGCHRHPVKHRHEWVNSGRAAATWHQLAREQEHRKELEMLETKALNALEQIRELHQPYWLDQDGERHNYYVTTSEPPEDHVCVIDGNESCSTEYDEHLVPACVECQQTTEDGNPGSLLWPCPTYRATELDQPSAEADA